MLWLSGRYNGEVYAIDTRTGHLRARIRVGSGPHGLSVWPQPGRYSLGHTGIMRCRRRPETLSIRPPCTRLTGPRAYAADRATVAGWACEPAGTSSTGAPSSWAP